MQGSSVLIKRAIMDESVGALDYAGNKLNTQDSPAIADEYMTPWMEYLYQQKPMPTNAIGVPISIDVLDANGNYRNIGSATSDVNSYYSFAWEPDIPGKYTVFAKFAGSESYYSSFGETAFVVDEKPQATPEPTPLPASPADVYFLPMSIGMIIAIVVIEMAIILMLRKR